jgi:hypothetical protein
MWRRIYFTFPERDAAARAVAELESAGVERACIHAIARPGVDIAGLPQASEAQRRDRVWFWEGLLWNGNLLLFFLALGGMVAGFAQGATGWALFFVGVMLASFLLGERFAVRVPDVHLSELRVPLLHREVVLLVDVARTRVAEIEHLVSRLHPEVGVAGVGWALMSGRL